MDYGKVLSKACENKLSASATAQIKRYSTDMSALKKLPQKLSRSSGVQSDTVKAFLAKRQQEQEQKARLAEKQKQELLEMRAIARNGRKANAMAKRTKDNNFMMNFSRTNELAAEQAAASASNIWSASQQGRRRFTQQPLSPQWKTPSSALDPVKTTRPVAASGMNLNFHDLLKVAAKKQHEPLSLPRIPKKNEPYSVQEQGRMMTTDEKRRFLEEQARKRGRPLNEVNVPRKTRKRYCEDDNKNKDYAQPPACNRTSKEMPVSATINKNIGKNDGRSIRSSMITINGNIATNEKTLTQRTDTQLKSRRPEPQHQHQHQQQNNRNGTKRDVRPLIDGKKSLVTSTSPSKKPLPTTSTINRKPIDKKTPAVSVRTNGTPLTQSKTTFKSSLVAPRLMNGKMTERRPTSSVSSSKVTNGNASINYRLIENSKISSTSSREDFAKMRQSSNLSTSKSSSSSSKCQPLSTIDSRLAPSSIRPRPQVPTSNLNNQRSRPFPSKNSMRMPRSLSPPSRQFPPSDLQRRSIQRPPINRRVESDEDEYDEEMDDFIDDGPSDDGHDLDYSEHIRQIFGYDRSKYRYEPDDDVCMESSFLQQMKEEAISAKMGILEDLEDIQREEEEMKRHRTCIRTKKKTK